MYQLHKNFDLGDGFYIPSPTFEPDPNGTACYMSVSDTTSAGILLHGQVYDSEDVLQENWDENQRAFDVPGDQTAAYCLTYVLALTEFSGATVI